MGGIVKPIITMSKIPKVGDIVHYNTTEQERKDMTNCPPHLNNEAKTLPAVVVAVWGKDENSSVNLKVFMDGNSEDLWKTSVPRGDGEMNWNFPAQE